MIESKEQVISDFREKAEAFLTAPSPLTGIDLDDATVTLKRYVLSEMQDEELGVILGRIQKPLRGLDLDSVTRLVAEVENRLAD